MARRSSRKRRKQRRRSGDPGDQSAATSRAGAPAASSSQGGAGDDDVVARGYARGRARTEAARAALEPLAEGERPTAVTVGALVAGGLALAEIVSFALGYSPGENERIIRSVLVVGLLSLMAWGMWRGRYWAVLGMQTLLGITIIYASAAALFAANFRAVVLVLAILAPAGALFWFLVKAMARIQMPERPGAR